MSEELKEYELNVRARLRNVNRWVGRLLKDIRKYGVRTDQVILELDHAIFQLRKATTIDWVNFKEEKKHARSK